MNVARATCVAVQACRVAPLRANFERMITLDHSPVCSDPGRMGGTLVFRGTRVPAQTLLDYLQDGYDLDGFLEEFPSVDRADAEGFLRLARPEPRP